MRRILAIGAVVTIVGIHNHASACFLPVEGETAFLAKVASSAKILIQRDSSTTRKMQTDAPRTDETEKRKSTPAPHDKSKSH